MDDRTLARVRARLLATASLMTVAGCEPKREEPAASVDTTHTDVPPADATIEASIPPADAAAETVDAVADAKADAHKPAAKPSASAPNKKPWIHVMI
jgi:hypothetical protein